MPPVVAKVAFCASCWRHWKPTNTIAPSTSQTVANLIVLGRSSLMGAPSACGRSRRAGWSFRFGAQVRDQLAEVERHLLAGVAEAGAVPVPGALEVEVEAPALPGGAELVRRYRDRAERRRRLALEEAEALGELGRNEVSQADVVGQH